MVIKTFSVTLEENIVEECKLYYKDSGGKLSPLLNKLLEDWLALQKKKKVFPIKKEIKMNADIDLLGDVLLK